MYTRLFRIQSSRRISDAILKDLKKKKSQNSSEDDSDETETTDDDNKPKVNRKIRNEVRNQIREQLVDELEDKIQKQIKEGIGELEENIDDKIKEKIDKKIEGKIKEEIDEKIEENIDQKIDDKINEKIDEKIEEKVKEEIQEQFEEQIPAKIAEGLREKERASMEKWDSAHERRKSQLIKPASQDIKGKLDEETENENVIDKYGDKNAIKKKRVSPQEQKRFLGLGGSGKKSNQVQNQAQLDEQAEGNKIKEKKNAAKKLRGRDQERKTFLASGQRSKPPQDSLQTQHGEEFDDENQKEKNEKKKETETDKNTENFKGRKVSLRREVRPKRIRDFYKEQYDNQSQDKQASKNIKGREQDRRISQGSDLRSEQLRDQFKEKHEKLLAEQNEFIKIEENKKADDEGKGYDQGEQMSPLERSVLRQKPLGSADSMSLSGVSLGGFFWKRGEVDTIAGRVKESVLKTCCELWSVLFLTLIIVILIYLMFWPDKLKLHPEWRLFLW